LYCLYLEWWLLITPLVFSLFSIQWKRKNKQKGVMSSRNSKHRQYNGEERKDQRGNEKS
jgi:hypothetical protein